jgi:hypothetical protein
MGLMIKETYVNVTRGYRFGTSGWYETDYAGRGELFRELQREYGRCTSKIYIDLPSGSPLAVGWVFEKKDRYDDTKELYTREVWVEVEQGE